MVDPLSRRNHCIMEQHALIKMLLSPDSLCTRLLTLGNLSLALPVAIPICIDTSGSLRFVLRKSSDCEKHDVHRYSNRTRVRHSDIVFIH